MKLFIALLISLTSTFAFRGTSDGGGGVGVRCGNQLEVLDKYEASLRGLELVEEPSSLPGTARLISEKLGHHFWAPGRISSGPYINHLNKTVVTKFLNGESFYNSFMNGRTQISYVNSLELSDDFGHYEIDDNCRLEQIAFFNDIENRLYIHLQRWNELSWLNKAFLVSHEIHYFMDRYKALDYVGMGGREVTSERIRKFVGNLYSVDGVESKYHGIPKISKYRCETNIDGQRPTMFYFFDGEDGAEMAFSRIHGYSSSYKTKVELWDSTINEYLDFGHHGGNSLTNMEIESDVEVNLYLRIQKREMERMHIQAFYRANGNLIPFGSLEEILCWEDEQ